MNLFHNPHYSFARAAFSSSEKTQLPLVPVPDRVGRGERHAVDYFRSVAREARLYVQFRGAADD